MGQQFVKAIGAPPNGRWIRKYARAADRLKHRDALDKQVENWTQNYPPEAVESILQSAGVGASPVASAKDIDEDPQMNYYNFYREIDHPFCGQAALLPPAPHHPLRGAHTAVRPPGAARGAYGLHLYAGPRHAER